MIGLVIFLLALIPQDWVVRRIESYVPYVVAVLCLFAFLAFRSSLHFENPVAFYKQAIATNPRNALAYNNLAHFEFSKGAYQSAISNFGAAIELNSHYADPICSRGAAYGTIGKYQESLADLNRCIQLESEYPDAHYNRARSHIQLNNLPAAIEDLNKVIRMRPRDALAYYYRGTTKQQMQDLASACDDWRTALELGEGRATQLLHANCR
jgi:tetratricopeptide (TPR) repeat protein